MSPAATTLADILGYHYYTELAHSAGMPKARIEEPGLAPKEKVGRLVEYLAPLENTIQSSWLIEMAQRVLRLRRTTRSTPATGKRCTTGPPRKCASPTGPQQVLQKQQAGSGVSDQRLRRSAGRLRHQRVHPLPADRRPGVSPGEAERARAAGEGDRHVGRTMPQSLRSGDRQAVRAFHRRAAPGPARFRCRRISRPRKVDGRARPARPLPRSGGRAPQPTDAAARPGALRVLDAGRVLRRVQAAVRPDDRRRIAASMPTASIKGRTCTTAASR